MTREGGGGGGAIRIFWCDKGITGILSNTGFYPQSDLNVN